MLNSWRLDRHLGVPTLLCHVCYVREFGVDTCTQHFVRSQQIISR